MNLWTRVKATFARWFGRASAGYTLTGAAFTWRGWLSANPWAWPRRGYRFYVPAGASRWRAAPLIVLLHGCKQSPEEIARGTRIEALADELCAYVLMPRQVERANLQFEVQTVSAAEKWPRVHQILSDRLPGGMPE